MPAKQLVFREDARKAVSRLLNPKVKHDPRLSTIIRLLDALNMSLKLLPENL